MEQSNHVTDYVTMEIYELLTKVSELAHKAENEIDELDGFPYFVAAMAIDALHLEVEDIGIITRYLMNRPPEELDAHSMPPVIGWHCDDCCPNKIPATSVIN